VRSQEVSDHAARVRLSLRDNSETRRMYPFGFEAAVEYAVTQGRLVIHYRLTASSANREPMFFSIGNHITFVTPLIPGSDPGNVLLVTPSRQELLKEDRIPTGKTRRRSHAEGIRLADFERLSAVSLTGYDGDPWVLLRDPQGLAIRISHHASRIPPQPVVQFNLWGDAPNGYFSPEPWVGLQNSLNLRQGLVYLDPGQAFDWTIRVTPERQ
jgi:galactose mutarotase-like enzyme